MSRSKRAPRLSIGMPVYNGEPYLSAALDSLLVQSFEDFELVISDNASTDGTEEICRELASRDPRIRYYRSDVNRGATWNHNHLIGLAHGAYFRWAADDDLLDPTILERTVDVLDRNPDVVLACTRGFDIDTQDRRFRGYAPLSQVDCASPHLRIRAIMRLQYPCYAAFGVTRLEVFRRAGGLGTYTGSDRVMLVNIALQGRLVELDDAMFYRRIHPASSGEAFSDPIARNTWFDPATAGRLSAPRARLALEWLKVIADASLEPAERARCVAEVGRWCAHYSPWLAVDATRLVPQLTARLAGLARSRGIV